MDLAAPAMGAPVGRDRQLAEMAELLAAARTGQGGAALILGEAGMGKSTLVQAAAGLAVSAGVVVHRGGFSAVDLPPYWPWRRILQGLVPAGVFAVSTIGTGDDRQQLFAAVLDALAELPASQPRLMVLEDLHWADQPSLLLLATLLPALPGLPLTLLATSRDEPGELPEPTRTRLAALPSDVRRIQLTGLDPPAVQALAGSLTGSPVPLAVAAQLRARTGGNPLFVREVVRLAQARGRDPLRLAVVPEGVRGVLERRLAVLSQGCSELLAAAAVLGDPIDEELLAAVTGQPDAELLDLIDEAVVARLVIDVAPRRPRFEFAHALVREVLESGLPGAERRRLHQRAAEALERADQPGGTVAAEHAQQLAHHWEQAGGDRAREAAARWWLRAARAAMDQLGYEQAVGYYRRVLDEPTVDRIAVLIELAVAQASSGDTAGARDSYLRAADLAAVQGRAKQVAVAALGLGGGVTGFEVRIRDPRQVEVLRAAEAALHPDEEDALLAAVRGRLSLALAELAPIAERVALARDAAEIARRAGDPRIEAATLAAYCDAMSGPDHVTERLAATERMLQLSRVDGDRGSELLARRLRLVALSEIGDFGAVDEEIVGYRATAAVVGLPLYLWLPELWAGMRFLLGGDPDAALAQAAQVEAIGARAGSDNAAIMGLALRMAAHHARGTASEIGSEMQVLMATFELRDRPAYMAVPALLLLEAGDTRYPGALLDQFLAIPPDQVPKDSEWLEAHWGLAELVIRLHRPDAAERLLETLQPYQRLWAVDGIAAAVYGTIGHQLGRLSQLLGRREPAAHWLRAALQDYRRAGAPLLVDQARAELAALGVADDEGSGAASSRIGRFRRDGAVWHLTWQGRTGVIADSKGLRDLAQLVGRPRQPISVLDLTELGGGPPAATAGADLGPVLDATARRTYRARLVELESEIADAEQAADLGRAERLRDERAMIAAELASALGLGGRPRVVGDPVERARTAVTMRIRSAIQAVERVDPALGQHLRLSIRTGRSCSYQPDGEVRWS